MKMTSKNLRWILMGGLGLSVILFIAVVSFGMSALSSQSRKMVDLKVKSQTADNQLSNLEQSKKDIEKYSYFRGIATSVIPNDKDQAVAVLEISQMAQASGVTIQSITFPSSSLGLRAAAPAATSSQDATSSGSAASAISQAKPVTGIPGLYSLELTITTPSVNNDLPANNQVTYPKMLDFLNRIENNRHTAQITDINIQPSELTQALSFSLTINIFIKP